jgi:TonB-linked SusC/RagA family outer membrane protein
MAFLSLNWAMAQTTVKGTVVAAEDGSAIPGATVAVKGFAGIGTITDFDGGFTVEVPDGGTTLIVSFVGYTDQEVAINGQASIKVSLQRADVGLDEVVVTALGVSKEKKAIGYSATTLGGDEIAASKTVNPMNALQGKVAGIDISTAPGPGATQNVMIRGASSFGNNQPLYVIDGVPIVNSQNRSGDNLNNQVDFGSGINAINPDDIANMTVLKGAAATALYGSRAANGVILITTKSGTNTKGKMQITYDGAVSFSQVGRIAERQNIFGQGWSGMRALDENGNWGPKYDGKDRVWGNIVDNSQQIKPYVFLENRLRDFYDIGTNYKNSISASGGNETTNYFLSFSHNAMDGVIPTDNDSYTRYTISTRGSHKMGKMKVSSSLNYANEKTSAVASGQGASVYRGLWEVSEDISIVDLADYKNNKFNTLDNYFTPYGVNPYFLLNENGAKQSKDKFFGKLQFDYELYENLNFTYRFGGDLENSNSEAWVAKREYSASSGNDGQKDPGSYEQVKRTRYEMNHDFLLTYKTSFATDFNLSALVGSNINQRGYNMVKGEITSIDVPGYYNLTNSLTPPVASQYQYKRRLAGVFANVDLDYKSYAFLTLTARNDWSSTLPLESNSFFYPGATASFVVTDFLEDKDISAGPLSFAKARVAYGWTGNDAAPYSIYPAFVQGSAGQPGFPNIDNQTFPLNEVNAFMVSNVLGNPGLKPELTKEIEAGIELNFFKNRLGFDLSYYNKVTEGLIANKPIDPSSGYTTQTTNIGDVQNKGFELAFFGTPIKTKDFMWKISVNYAQNQNEVLSLEGADEISLAGLGGSTIVAKEGFPMGVFKTYVPKTNDEGQYIVNGNGLVQQSADLTVVEDKDVNEKFRAGLTNTLSWKGLTLSATLDLRYGGYMYSYMKGYQAWTGSGIETTYNDRRPFIVPNSVVELADGTFAENTIPVDQDHFHNFYGDQGAFEAGLYELIDRSYLKLREVSLSYNLPKSLTSRLNVQGIRLNMVAGNILLWTPVENQYIDPEVTTFGNDINAKFGEFGANPTNQVYTVGLTINL